MYEGWKKHQNRTCMKFKTFDLSVNWKTNLWNFHRCKIITAPNNQYFVSQIQQRTKDAKSKNKINNWTPSKLSSHSPPLFHTVFSAESSTGTKYLQECPEKDIICNADH